MLIGIILTVIGLVGSFIIYAGVLQFSIVPMEIYSRTDTSGNRIAVAKWVRTEGPGTISGIPKLSIYTTGDQVVFGGYVQVSSSSPRPIKNGVVSFEVYGPVDKYNIRLVDEKCYLKRVYCGSSPCTSSVVVASYEKNIGEIAPGQRSAEIKFTVDPKNLQYGKYITIMYVQDTTYTEKSCETLGFTTLAIDYWNWEYGKWAYTQYIKIAKTIGMILFPLSLIGGALLIFGVI